jgi:hypothetical protein
MREKNHNLMVDNKSFKNMAKLNLGTIVTKQNKTAFTKKIFGPKREEMAEGW